VFFRRGFQVTRITTRERLCIFFAANPDEELTTQDIKDKFGLNNINRVRETLALMDKAGLVKRERLSNHASAPHIVRPGPELLRGIHRHGA
jgi:hypothetical protein